MTVADFNVDEDVLDLSNNSLTFETLINTEVAAISNASSLFDAVQLAASYIDTDTDGAGADTDDADAASFTYGGNTYILFDADDSGDFSDDDGLIEIQGITASELNGSTS